MKTDEVTMTRDAEATAPLAFPDGFVWGSATASYQIEGAIDEGGKGRSWWDDFSHTRGKVYKNQNGDVACDHYHRMAEDVALMKSMGIASYRFSISWARVFPNGTTDRESEEGVAFYRRLLQLLKEHGIRAAVTLYHWDLPSALAAKGGWLSPKSPEWFEAYASRCFELFDSEVDLWITFNEPWCMCALGYGSGVHAPGHRLDPGNEPYIAAHHTLLAHAAAYAVYKRRWGAHPIGITLNCEWREPRRQSSPIDASTVQRELDFMLGWFADPIFLDGDYPAVMRTHLGSRLPTFTAEQQEALKGSSDFFGFNWYSGRMSTSPRFRGLLASLPSLIRMAKGEPFGLWGWIKEQLSAQCHKKSVGNYFADIGAIPSFRASWQVTDMTWPVVPWALSRFLVHISKKYAPRGGIYITENGVAVKGEDQLESAMDTRRGRPGAKRVSYVRSHLVAIQRAVAQGADVRGYFLWSLLDNFEWAFGYAKRFGAFHVDYSTQVRTPKPVVAFYRSVIEANAVRPSESESRLDPFAPAALDFRVDDW